MLLGKNKGSFVQHSAFHVEPSVITPENTETTSDSQESDNGAKHIDFVVSAWQNKNSAAKRASKQVKKAKSNPAL